MNQNDGFMVGAGTLASALFAAVAAVAAWVTIRSSKRRNQPRLYLAVSGVTDSYVHFALHNLGLVRPVMTFYFVTTIGDNPEGGGTMMRSPEPGRSSEFEVLKKIAKRGVWIEISWIDQNGKEATMKRWFKAAWNSDGTFDSRTDVVLPGTLQGQIIPRRPFDRKPPRG